MDPNTNNSNTIQNESLNTKNKSPFTPSKFDILLVFFIFFLIDIACLTVLVIGQIFYVILIFEFIVITFLSYSYIKNKQIKKLQQENSNVLHQNTKTNKILSLVNFLLLILFFFLATFYIRETTSTGYDMGYTGLTFWFFGIPILLLLFILATRFGNALSLKHTTGNVSGLLIHGLIMILLIILNFWVGVYLVIDPSQSAKQTQAYKPIKERSAIRIRDQDSITKIIFNYKNKYKKLPTDFAVLEKAGYIIPVDPLTKLPYEYVHNENNFMVCFKDEANYVVSTNCLLDGIKTINPPSYTKLETALEIAVEYGPHRIICYCNGQSRIFCTKNCATMSIAEPKCNKFCALYGETQSGGYPTCDLNECGR